MICINKKETNFQEGFYSKKFKRNKIFLFLTYNFKIILLFFTNKIILKLLIIY